MSRILTAKKEGSLWHCQIVNETSGKVWDADLTECEYKKRRLMERLAKKLTPSELHDIERMVDEQRADARDDAEMEAAEREAGEDL